MRRVIHRLRERPEDERKTIAGTVAIGISVVLFLGWGASFLYGQNAPQPTQAQNGVPAPAVVSNPAANYGAAAASVQWGTATSTGH